MRAGAELDLSKAFDTVDYPVAEAALLHHGVHPAVCHLVRQARAAPRHCCVHGALAAPIRPCRGIPQGDPLSPATLGFVLAPWAPFPGGSGRWAYMDDRTLAELDTAPRGALQHGLEATAAFDAAVGLQENAAKRQVWVAGEGTVVEHLGLRLKPDDPSFPICPRDSWAGASEVITRLATIPGPVSVREHLASAFVLPYFRWAAPLLHPAPPALAPWLFRAVLATDCSWWCPGRWWAQRVQLHPVLGAAVHCVKRASTCARSFSPHLLVDFAAPCHFQIGLDLLGCCGFCPGACFCPGGRFAPWVSLSCMPWLWLTLTIPLGVARRACPPVTSIPVEPRRLARLPTPWVGVLRGLFVRVACSLSLLGSSFSVVTVVYY